MNEVIVLNRLDDAKNGAGVIDGNAIEVIDTFGKSERARDLIKPFLRKTGESKRFYESTEALLVAFIQYLEGVTLE
jgi:hypothetical protein